MTEPKQTPSSWDAVIETASYLGVSVKASAALGLKPPAELGNFLSAVGNIKQNPAGLLEPIGNVLSQSTSIDFSAVTSDKKTSEGLYDLFSKHVIPPFQKAYDDITEAKNNEKTTAFGFFKTCLKSAKGIYNGITKFKKEAEKEYPAIMAIDKAIEAAVLVSCPAVYTAVTACDKLLPACEMAVAVKEYLVDGESLANTSNSLLAAAGELAQTSLMQNSGIARVAQAALKLGSEVLKPREPAKLDAKPAPQQQATKSVGLMK